VQRSDKLLQLSEARGYLDRIITCDKKWILYDNTHSGNPKTWRFVNQKPAQKAKLGRHMKKIIVTVWWTSQGVIRHSFLFPGQTMNASRYCKEIRKIHAKLAQKQPALVNRKGVVLLHDNAKLHTARETKELLKELNYTVLDHPPYSPDLSPTDYNFFFHLELFVRQKKYATSQQVKRAFSSFVKRGGSKFCKVGIYKLREQCQKCIDANGSYFK
jgi:histone-lysine N-methyltransferase SETMAR